MVKCILDMSVFKILSYPNYFVFTIFKYHNYSNFFTNYFYAKLIIKIIPYHYIKSLRLFNNSFEISIAFGLLVVPLKHICSKKCEIPFISFVSYFEPASTNTKTVTVGLSFIGAITTRKPFFKTFFVYFIIILIYF